MSDSAFLPENYKVPSSNDNYMKFQDGENKFRILSAPVIGWVDWDDNKKVYRTKTREEQPEVSRSSKAEAKISHFWAMSVWNYSEKRIQILEIKQSTIQKGIKVLVQDEDWGKPYTYDILVTRSKENGKTSYTVSPKPKKDLTDEVLKAQAEKRINLEALFTGADPFNSSPMNENVDPEFMNDVIK